MAKYRGIVGFAVKQETTPGVWSDVITEHTYRGDTAPNIRIAQVTDQINDEIVPTDQIRIVADAFAKENFQQIRFAEYMGAVWKVTSVKPQYPRLILTLGGIYRGKRQTKTTR